MNHYRRGLAHAHRVADSLPEPPPPEKVVPNTRLPVVQYGQSTPTPRATSSEALKAMVRPLQVERASLVVRMARTHAHNGERGEIHVLRELPLAERQQLALKWILELKDYPRPEDRFQAYVISAMSIGFDWSPKEDEKFLTQVEAIDHPAIPAAVANARRVLAEEAKRRTPNIAAVVPVPGGSRSAPPPAATLPKLADDPDAQIVFRPVVLPWKSSGPGHRCELCLAAGDGADLFCTSNQILLMKKKGEAKVIWEEFSGPLGFRQFLDRNMGASFDGKYAWIPVFVVTKLPRLLVVDPQSGKVTEVTAEHGLPKAEIAPHTQAVMAATPLSPGKVLLVGSFGQTWLAIATFDPDKGPSVKVIHECVEQAPFNELTQWQSAKLAFWPQYLATLKGKQKGSGEEEQRVIVGRNAGGGAFSHPLLVNPETNEVEVLEADYTVLLGREPFFFEGALYSAMHSRANQGTDIWRVGFPDFRPELIANQPFPMGMIVMEPDRVHLINDKWHTSKSWKEPLKLRPMKLPEELSPPGMRLTRSRHYDWLAQGLNAETFAVEFLEEGAKPSEASDSAESPAAPSEPR